MPKRPDQHNLDPGEAGATDYKFRRQAEDGVQRSNLEPVEYSPARGGARTPGEELEARRAQSERAREIERGDDDRDGPQRREGLTGADREDRERSLNATARDQNAGEIKEASEHIDRSDLRERVRRDREDLGRGTMEADSAADRERFLLRRDREAEENERP